MKQETLFSIQDITGELKPVTNSNTPYNHQLSSSKAQSAIALEIHKASRWHIPQKERIKAFLLRNPGSTLAEISAGTGILQRGTVTARFENLREEGWNMIDNKGKWSIEPWKIKNG